MRTFGPRRRSSTASALERQLAPGTVLSLDYAGARGLHLYDIKNYNGLGSGNVFLGDPLSDGQGNVALTRLNPQYSNINNRGSGGDSYYHAMNIQFQMTNLHHTGLSLVANYTLAHATDELSTSFSETAGAFNLGYTNPFYPALDHGNGDLDIRNRLVIAPIYQTPYFTNGHSSLKQALFGWQVTGIYTVRTGYALQLLRHDERFAGRPGLQHPSLYSDHAHSAAHLQDDQWSQRTGNQQLCHRRPAAGILLRESGAGHSRISQWHLRLGPVSRRDDRPQLLPWTRRLELRRRGEQDHPDP